MTRGTTPTVSFMFPFDLSTLSEIHITFSQRGVTIDKEIVNVGNITGTILTCSLTQAETLSLSPGVVQMQVRAKTTDGLAIASTILTTQVGAILKDGTI